MTRRSVFEQVGGFDPEAGALWNVDYCLRIRAAGLRVAVTPHARVRRTTDRPATARPAGALARLRARWGTQLERDPYYNPNFDRHAATFRLPS